MMKYIHQTISWSNKLSPRTRKIILIALWCVAPIEMLIITGIWKGVSRYAKVQRQ